MEKAKPLLLQHFHADLVQAARRDQSTEVMVLLTMFVRSAGTVQPLPSIWIPPAILRQVIDSLETLYGAATGRTPDTPPPTRSH
jgi:hypothetical protein